MYSLLFNVRIILALYFVFIRANATVFLLLLLFGVGIVGRIVPFLCFLHSLSLFLSVGSFSVFYFGQALTLPSIVYTNYIKQQLKWIINLVKFIWIFSVFTANASTFLLCVVFLSFGFFSCSLRCSVCNLSVWM